MFKSPYLMIDELNLSMMVQKSNSIKEIEISLDKAIIKMASEEREISLNFEPVLQKSGSRAMISIDGPMVFNPDLIDRIIFGAVSTQELMAAVDDVRRDKKIESVVFNVNSGGGEAMKIHVLAEMINTLSQQKATAAVNTGMMASAAFFAASQTGNVFVEDKLNETGSIGTVTVLSDFTEAMKMAGINVTKIATGPLKGAGMMGTPITPAIVEMVQEKVDEIQEGFSEAVERARPEADMKDGSKARSGASFFFKDAKKLGLVDQVKDINGAFKFLEQGNRASKIKQSI